MFVPLDYVEEITHSLKVGFFLSFVVIFLTIASIIVKSVRDENENNL
jgi:hypothetical protein